MNAKRYSCLCSFLIVGLVGFFHTYTYGQNTQSAEEIIQIWAHHNELNNRDSSMYYGDLYIDYQQKHGNEQAIVDAYHHKIKSYNQFKQYARGFALAIETYYNYCNKEKPSDNCLQCGTIYIHLADFMKTAGNYRQALRYLEQGLTDNQFSPYILYEKARVYVLLNEPDSALLQTKLAISRVKENGTPSELISAYNRHGVIARNLKRFEKAGNAFSSAAYLIDSLNLPKEPYAYIIGNLGSCHYQLGDLKKSREHLLFDSEASRSKGMIESFINAEILLARIDYDEGKFTQSIFRLNKLLDDYKTGLTIPSELNIRELLIQANDQIGNHSKSSIHKEAWMRLNKEQLEDQKRSHREITSEYSKETARLISEKTKSETKLLEQKLAIQQSESSKKTLQMLLLAVGLAFVITLFFFILFKVKKANRLKDIKLSLSQKESELLNLRLNHQTNRSKELSYELLSKQSLSKKIVNRVESIDGISSVEIKKIEQFIQNELDIRSTSLRLYEQMDELADSFYFKLNEKHTDLTKSEVLLAGMVAMNMGNKDIAISKNISTDSVKTMKNRLKKKLNLSLDEDLHEYLNKMINS